MKTQLDTGKVILTVILQVLTRTASGHIKRSHSSGYKIRTCIAVAERGKLHINGHHHKIGLDILLFATAAVNIVHYPTNGLGIWGFRWDCIHRILYSLIMDMSLPTDSLGLWNNLLFLRVSV